MSPTRLLLPALAAALLVPPAAAQAAPQVVEASVTTSGMVLLVLDARLDDEGRLAFDVPARHLDDWLKSVRLPPGWRLLVPPAPERIPLPPQDAGPDALLAALGGQEIRHLRQDRLLQAGRVAGLRPPVPREGADPHPVLALQGPQGITLEPWRPGDRLEAADPRLAQALEAALVARAGETLAPRRGLLLQGPPGADGRLEVLLGGPVWNASHRAAIGEDGAIRLETVAHVKNETGLPWTGVRLVLVSGEARAIAVPLSTPRQAQRAPQAQEPPRNPRAVPAPMAAGASALARQSLADGAALEAAPAPPPAEIAQGQPAAAVFRLATPLTLADGALATLPLAAETPAGGVVRSLRAGGRTTEIALRLARPPGADLQARLQDADRRVARLAQGITPERERAARLLQGAEQAEALAALAQAARAHAQAVAQRDRLGADLEALEASLRRDGARLAFGTPP